MFQTTISINQLLYDDLPCDTFAERIKKAKLLAGISQEELSKITGLSRSTICDLEAGYRDRVSKDTLHKLLKVLDKDILCDDYHMFVLNQEENISNLIKKYGYKTLVEKISDRSTIDRWKSGKFQVSKNKYILMKELLDQD